MSEPAESEEAETKPRRFRWARIGVVLMGLSCLLWFSLFAIPFLKLTTEAKVLTGGIVFGAVQVTWWGGAALAGPEAVRRFRGWFSRRKAKP